jgi:phosphate transport system substrate-binding protein
MMSSKRMVAFAAVAALALAACGDDDDDSSSATTAAPATTEGAVSATTAPGATTMAPATTEATGGSSEAPATTEGSTGTPTPLPDFSAISGELDGSGASSQSAAMAAWQAGFQALAPDSTIEYDPVGSGGGREAFLAGGNVNFAGSDAYLKDEELATSKDRCAGDQGAIDLPHYVSPIAIAYNVPDLEGTDLQLSPETIAKIFTNQITNWNDEAIAADNPGVELPDLALNPVHRSDDSGTTANFTDYMSKVAADVWTFGSIQDWNADGPGGGEGADKTSGVVAAIGAGEGSIGYADESQIGELPAALVEVGSEYVGPSAEAAAKVLDISPRVEGRGDFDFAFDLVRDTTESGVYPIVLVSYHIVCLQYDSQDTVDLVKGFMTYVGSAEGQQAAADAAGSAPISDDLRAQMLAAVNTISVGS